jgi:hypothetical protein
MSAELRVDARGRANLASVRTQRHDRYLVDEYPNGTLVLTPAVLLSVAEVAALKNPGLMAAVAQAAAGDRSQVRQRDIPSRWPPGR